MGWLIALAVLLLLAWLPLGVVVKYNASGLSLKVIAGPFRIGILPKQEKKEKQTKEEKPKEAAASAKKPAASAKKEQGGSATDFLPLLQTAMELLNAFRKKLRVDRLELKLILAGDDPCDLAVSYGRAWACVGDLMPLLERCFVIQKRDIEVECDFEATRTLIMARLDLTVTLGRLLGILVWYGVRALKQFISIQNKRKGGKTV